MEEVLVAGMVAGAALFGFIFRQKPPRCPCCKEVMHKFPAPAQIRREHTHYCANDRCKMYEFGGAAWIKNEDC